MATRRAILKSIAAAALAQNVPFVAKGASTGRASIEILKDQEIGNVSPDLYGYLLENLGNAIYDGVWVGKDSRIPNVGGIRKALIERLRAINASVIRWPGGNYADYYNWRDGIGPVSDRPRRTNFWSDYMSPAAPNGPQRFDPNLFGTDEFMNLCSLSGGRPYLNMNTRSLNPEDLVRWIEYCNSPSMSSTLGELRMNNGHSEPYGVRYWGIGNEPWMAGGNLSVEEYFTSYKRFTAGLPKYGRDLYLVACGSPPGQSQEWVSAFMRLCRRSYLPVPVSAISVHYYGSLVPMNDLKPGQTVQDLLSVDPDAAKLAPIDPVSFDEPEWYEYLDRAARIRQVIESCWKVMGESDPTRKTKLVIDEWGGICKSGTELSAVNFHDRAVTLRDALAAALTLDIFHGHCDKIDAANFTGLINQEGGLFRAQGEQFLATPVYYVFAIYAAHQGGQSVRTLFDAPPFTYAHNGEVKTMNPLAGSATVRGNMITLTVVNLHATHEAEPSISVRGSKIESASLTRLTASDVHAQNTFEEPRKVQPVTTRIGGRGRSIVARLPPASISRFTLQVE